MRIKMLKLIEYRTSSAPTTRSAKHLRTESVKPERISCILTY